MFTERTLDHDSHEETMSDFLPQIDLNMNTLSYNQDATPPILWDTDLDAPLQDDQLFYSHTYDFHSTALPEAPGFDPSALFQDKGEAFKPGEAHTQTKSRVRKTTRRSTGFLPKPPKVRKPKSKTLRAHDWEPVKARIIEHCKTQCLCDVMAEIKREFGFEATHVTAVYIDPLLAN